MSRSGSYLTLEAETRRVLSALIKMTLGSLSSFSFSRIVRARRISPEEYATMTLRAFFVLLAAL